MLFFDYENVSLPEDALLLPTAWNNIRFPQASYLLSQYHSIFVAGFFYKPEVPHILFVNIAAKFDKKLAHPSQSL